MKAVNIGMVGYKFMGKAHSHAYRDLPMFFPNSPYPIMKAICGRDKIGVVAAQQQFGWETYETDWKVLVARDDIDMVDINTPTYLHKEIAIEAARRGKHILCEKPLAMNLLEAREMLEAAESAGVKHMCGFNYRFTPAIQLAKKIIAGNRIGKIHHFQAHFLQDWLVDRNYPLTWRLDRNIAGSGALGDLGAHIIDLARYLVGELQAVIGMSETFIKERQQVKSSSEWVTTGKVTVDDATFFMSRFVNGAMGSFAVSRLATGHRSQNSFEVTGSKGSIIFDFERMNELHVYFVNDDEDVQGFRKIITTDPSHPYSENWWPPGHMIGYEHTFVHEIAELMDAIQCNRLPSPSFVDGVKCQQVLEAIDLSIKNNCWIKIDDV